MSARFEERENRRAARMMRDTKPVLVLALQDMPTICPPSPRKQRASYLRGIVNRALAREDGDPVRIAMQNALKSARRWIKTVNEHQDSKHREQE